MIKRISLVVATLLALFLLAFNIHKVILSQGLTFSLLNIYLFFTVSAIIVYGAVEAVFSKLPNQAGYAYLMMMCLKIGAFVLIFQQDVFAKTNLLQVERLSLVVPLFLFLVAEALAVVNLLNSK
jgi:hypothetical protein